MRDSLTAVCSSILRTGETSDDLWAPNPNGAPESHAGMTPAGDVWSLGMTLVEVLTQHAPAWDAAGTRDPVVPEHLEAPFLDIARRCLRSDPRLRCSLAEIALALQPAASAAEARPIAAAAVPAAKPVAPGAAPNAAPNETRKRSYLLPVAGAILAGVLCTFAILTGTRLLSSPSATEARRAAPVEQHAQTPPTAPVTPVVAEVAPPSGGATSSAPTPEPEPEAAPTPAASLPAATEHSTGGRPSGEVVDRFVPEVPPQILRTIRGKVKVGVQVTIDPSGAVADAKLDSPSGGKYFSRLALDAARRWKFKPASDAGHDVASTRLVRFEFRRDGCEASADQARP